MPDSSWATSLVVATEPPRDDNMTESLAMLCETASSASCRSLALATADIQANGRMVHTNQVTRCLPLGRARPESGGNDELVRSDD